MNNRDEELTPETVNELVEQLLQTPMLHSSPLAQTVHNLRELFEEDRSLEEEDRSLERVWARLASQSQLLGEREKPPEKEIVDGGKLVQTHHHSDNEALAAGKNPLRTVPGKNETIQEGKIRSMQKVQPVQKEHSPMPLNSEVRREAAPRMTRFPRAARFIQMAAAILIVGVLLTGFLLVFSTRSAAPHQTTQAGSQPSSPPGLYISRSDGVYRYNRQTHKVIWHTHVAGQSLFAGDPVLIDQTLYIVTDSWVSALDAQTGTLRWSHDFQGRVTDPYMDKGLLYFTSFPPLSDALYVVNSANGTISATYTPQYGKSWYNPVVVDGILYYTDGMSADTLYAVQLPSEKLLWQRQLSTEPLNIGAGGGIVVQSGIVYMPVTPMTTSQNGWIDTFDAYTGKPLWQSPAIMVADGGTTLAITNTMIYVSSLFGTSGKLLAFDVHTHTLVWQEPWETYDMQVVSDTLYIHYGIPSDVQYPPEYVGIAALNAITGKLLWKTPINRAAGDELIGILQGVLYDVTWTTFTGNAYTGTINALKARDGTQIWAMPTDATVLQWGGMVVA